MCKCQNCTVFRPINLPPGFRGEFYLRGKPVSGLELGDLNQDAKSVAGVNKNFLPDASGVLIVTKEGDSMRF